MNAPEQMTKDVAYCSVCEMIDGPKQEVRPKVHARLHRVFPAVNMPNFHEDNLIRRRRHEESLDTGVDGIFVC